MEPTEKDYFTEYPNCSNIQERILAVVDKNNWGSNPATRIEKVSEEIVEFYEALYDQKDDFTTLSYATATEAADIVITLMAFLAVYDIDLLREVEAKTSILENGTREPRGWRKKIHINKQNVENGVRLTITALKV